jgi:hypothetical protein
VIETVGVVPPEMLNVEVAQAVFPAESVAQTVTVCVPDASPEYEAGEVQDVAAPPSSLQVVVYGGVPPETENVQDALVPLGEHDTLTATGLGVA